MTDFDQAVTDYLAVRRALGYKLEENAKQLRNFVAYLDTIGASTVTTEVAVAWATQPTGATPVWWARRLAMVRGFTRHLKAIDPQTEIPPLGVLPYRLRRTDPYLYSDTDVENLIGAARALPSPQRAATYETLIGLLSVTGMRCGEAVRLDRDHIDWDEGVITIWNSKFQKHRAIPLHATSIEALRRYTQIRDQFCPHPTSPAFFLSTVGTRLDHDTLNHVFRGLIQQIGLDVPGRRRPRPHDLRHRFAVKTLIGWYRRGLNVEARMPLLSTYLGHGDIAHTFWYLSGGPELLLLASKRLERAERARP
jgi:integrase/recombinase XerD